MSNYNFDNARKMYVHYRKNVNSDRQQQYIHGAKTCLSRFIKQCIYEQIEVDIYLSNDSMNRGYIQEFDNKSIVFKSGGQKYLFFHNAIISIIQVNSSVSIQDNSNNKNIFASDFPIKNLNIRNKNIVA